MELALRKAMKNAALPAAEAGMTVQIPIRIFVGGIITLLMGIIGVVWMMRGKQQTPEENEEELQENPEEFEENEECRWICGSRPEVYHLSKGCGKLNRKNSRTPRMLNLCTECRDAK